MCHYHSAHWRWLHPGVWCHWRGMYCFLVPHFWPLLLWTGSHFLTTCSCAPSSPLWLIQEAFVGRPVALKVASFPTPVVTDHLGPLAFPWYPLERHGRLVSGKYMKIPPPPKNIGVRYWCVFYASIHGSKEPSEGRVYLPLSLNCDLKFASPLWWPDIRN